MFGIISLIIASKCCVFLLRVFKNYCYDLSDNSLEKCLKVFNVCSATYIFLTESHQPFHDGGRYHIETSPLICRANGSWKG